MGARRKGCISSFVYLPPSVPRASESLHCLSLRPRLCTFRGNDGQYSVVISEQLLLTSQRPARTMKMASWFFDNSDRRRCASGGSVFSQMANLRQDAGGGKARSGIGRGRLRRVGGIVPAEALSVCAVAKETGRTVRKSQTTRHRTSRGPNRHQVSTRQQLASDIACDKRTSSRHGWVKLSAFGYQPSAGRRPLARFCRVGFPRR